MSAHQTLVDGWIKFVNAQDADLGRSILAADVLVIAYLEGVGGPETRYEGLEAVLQWADRTPPGRYVWEVQSVDPTAADPRLPACEATLKVKFVIRIVMAGDWSGWTNPAKWIIAVNGDRIVGVVYEPNALTDAQWAYADNKSRTGQPE